MNKIFYKRHALHLNIVKVLTLISKKTKIFFVIKDFSNVRFINTIDLFDSQCKENGYKCEKNKKSKRNI